MKSLEYQQKKKENENELDRVVHTQSELPERLRKEEGFEASLSSQNKINKKDGDTFFK